MNEGHLVLTLQKEVRNLRAKLEVVNNKLRQNKIINRGTTYNDLHKRQRINVINKIKKEINLNKEMKKSEYAEKSVNDYIFLKDKSNISNNKWNFLRSFLLIQNCQVII
jgi:hypothetical protein